MTFTYRVLLKPKDICFKKKLLPSSFDNGIPLRETLQQLVNDEILIEDVPTIDVVWCKEKWAWYTLNNRRLWVFRELEKQGKCQYIATKRVETIEHVTDFLLYGSAELIGESSLVSWDSEDGLKITVFDECKASDAEKSSTNSLKEDVPPKEKTKGSDSRNAWRERTPLTIKVTWDGKGEKSDSGAELPISEEKVKRERKDSGFSETSSARSVEKSRAYGDDTESECESEDDVSVRGSKARKRRFNKFHRYRPYSCPESSDSPSERKEKVGKKRHSRLDALRNLVRQRKGVFDRWLFILHHGNKPRNEHNALKTKLMNTCGFCYKSFGTGVSLSQHVEELGHWACVRCGKYFKSYTALGQHKLSLDHCNV